MREHIILFSGLGQTPADERGLLEALKREWPADVSFRLQSLALPALMERLRSSGPEVTDGASAVVLIFGSEAPGQLIDQAHEALFDSGLAGVILTPSPDAFRAFQRHGVLFESHEASKTRLATLLYALCERHATVRALSREVALAQRCQGGIRHEMDKIHDELHLAAAVQRELAVSPVPKVEGLEFGVLFRPLSFVSGDVYWLRQLDRNYVAFFLADAVGHGVPAALLTVVLTQSLVTHEEDDHGVRCILEPGEVLRRLNQRLCDSCLSGGRFATGVYGVIHAQTREVRLAGAGHPHPIVLGLTSSRTVETDGPLLGIIEQAEFPQTRFTLEHGQTLVIYTDGLEASLATERRRKGVGLYIDRLTSLEACVNSPQRLVDELHTILDTENSSLQHADDITALCIAPAPEAQEIRTAA